MLFIRNLLSEAFLLSTADHIFEPELMKKMASIQLQGDELVNVLVEKDIEGMIGLPGSAVQVELNGTKIKQLGHNLSNVDGLDAGLFICKVNIFINI